MKRDVQHPEDRGAAAMRILDAADALLTETGLEGLSARAVATRAGVHNALVFYYFGSRSGLVDRVLARYYDRHLAALEAALGHEGPQRERMHRLVDAYVSFIEDNRRYPRLIQHQLAGPAELRQRVQDNLAPLLAWTRSALAGIAPDTGPTSARHFFVTISAAVINYYTYAEVLAPTWGGDPLDATALAERRAHLHWLVDALVTRLEGGSVGAEATITGKGSKPSALRARRAPRAS